MSGGGPGAGLARALPALWLAVFVGLPFLIVLRIALSDPVGAQPPYLPRFEGWGSLGDVLAGLDLEKFGEVLAGGIESLYVEAYLSSARIAGVATLIALVIGFPIAQAIARARGRTRAVLLMLIILPFWTSFLIRIYAWIGILRSDGFLNGALGALGLPAIRILDTEAAVVLGLVYGYLPFMVLPIYAALEKQDMSLHEAAADLGATAWRRFVDITLPLAAPGILAGCLLMFIPAVGEFIVPDLLGGSETLMIGRTVWTEFFSNRDWPLASAIAVLLVLLLAVPMALLARGEVRR